MRTVYSAVRRPYGPQPTGNSHLRIFSHVIYFKIKGRPSGDAFIQMMSPEWAARAALDQSKGGCHKKHMGER